MTSINTFADILEAMERDPQLRAAMRGYILGEDFQQVPAAVSRLETKVDGLETKVDGLEGKVDGLEVKVDGLETKVADLQAGQERIEGVQRRMSGQIGNLEGHQYEMRVAQFFVHTARRDLNLIGGKILQSHYIGPDPELTAMIEEAEDRQAITVEQGYHLGRADIILQGTNRANQEFTYAIAEISKTIDQHDIQRAAERASTLTVVTGHPAIASVVGSQIDARNRQQADDAGVVAIVLRD